MDKSSVGHEIALNTLIPWKGGGNGRRFSGGLASSEILTWPLESRPESDAGDNPGPTPGTGDYPLHRDTVYAIEGNIAVSL